MYLKKCGLSSLYALRQGQPQLKMQQMKMGIPIVKKEEPAWQEITKLMMGFHAEQCPCCKTGKMITILFFRANAPPARTNVLITNQAA
jgi:hypothetical protein